jgi:hypothetical protein
MKTTTTPKSCSYCGNIGHTVRSCAVKAVGAPSLADIKRQERANARLAAIAEKERVKAEKAAAKEAAKAEKERVKAENRSWRTRRQVCSFCGDYGHSRTACATLKETRVRVVAFSRAWRAKVWDKIKHLPYGVGAMLDFRGWGTHMRDGVITSGRPQGADRQMVVGINLTSNPLVPFSFEVTPIANIGGDRYGNNTFNGFVPYNYLTNELTNRVRRYADYYDTDSLEENEYVSRFNVEPSAATIADTIDARVVEDWLNFTEEHFNRFLKARYWRRKPNHADVVREFHTEYIDGIMA